MPSVTPIFASESLILLKNVEEENEVEFFKKCNCSNFVRICNYYKGKQAKTK